MGGPREELELLINNPLGLLNAFGIYPERIWCTFVHTKPHLHLGLDLFAQLLELVHIGGLGRPADAETFSLVGLGDLRRGQRKKFKKGTRSLFSLTMWK